MMNILRCVVQWVPNIAHPLAVLPAQLARHGQGIDFSSPAARFGKLWIALDMFHW